MQFVFIHLLFSSDEKSTQTDKSYGRVNKKVQTHSENGISPAKDDGLNSRGSSSIQSRSSLSTSQQDVFDKHNDGISPRLHQLVRVGPDGRPEVIGRIGRIIQLTNFYYYDQHNLLNFLEFYSLS